MARTYISRYAKMMNNNKPHIMSDSVDYYDLYLTFLSQHKTYVDNLGYSATQLVQIAKEYYNNVSSRLDLTESKKKSYIQFWFFTNYIDETERKQWLIYEARKIKNEVINEDEVFDIRCVYFVTIGFSHSSTTKNQLLAIRNILANKKVYAPNSYGVYERFRNGGDVHPHCHFKIHLKEYLRPSKVAEIFYAVAGVKKVCENKSFIDVKKFIPVYDNYLVGDKAENKLPDVARDRLYRSENDIPDKICV